MNRRWWWVAGAIVAALAVSIGLVLVLRPQPLVWLDTSGEVTVLRNRASEADAALHRGSFAVGSDSCLYVVVEDDAGKVKYLAVVSPETVVDRQQIRQGQLAYAIGEMVTFSRAGLPAEVPPEAFERCSEATQVYSVDLAR